MSLRPTAPIAYELYEVIPALATSSHSTPLPLCFDHPATWTFRRSTSLLVDVSFASRCGVGYMPVLCHSSNTCLRFPSFLIPACLSRQPVSAGVLSTELMLNYTLALFLTLALCLMKDAVSCSIAVHLAVQKGVAKILQSLKRHVNSA